MFGFFKKREAATPAPANSDADASPKVPRAADSPLGELWIDQNNALDQADRLGLDALAAADLRQFISQGYLVIPGAISEALADQIVADAHRVRSNPGDYVVRDKGAYINPAHIEEFHLGHRIIDLYAVSAAAREAVFTPRASRLLNLIFGEPALAIQSLYFEYGSQQAVHQDTAYVVSRKPLALAAIWIALEDVQPGTGELCYYPGGHRLPHDLFGGTRKHWIQSQDGVEEHQRYLKSLRERSEAAGLTLETFLPKKGDVLLWHADLPHGGTRISTLHTRRSYVLHFAPKSVKANYMSRIGADYHEHLMPTGDGFSCRHYALAKMRPDGRAPILFDGGISRR
ncbi:phytanoyl-CoA dioxygenase family protein [Ideonella paludis]|uniref:Phytanoyl-CoA dioxygenase family protein n=1 Tax=Ideonella paludis TaxID=1233411 RepID=A0ABS5DTH8_9BURK|nr:phytanoyl-CoA dioxygenase family protein [Ideonella paludis]MBQ0934410.1 phytanoyl-CoA dioxygenase family protein [Ideonella paludis]